jgi:hypothetical protein
MESMTEELQDPVAADQLRLSVEMGDDFQPSPRLAAALTELTAALEDESEADVEGFTAGIEKIEIAVRSLSFDSRSPGRFGAIKPLDKASPLLQQRGTYEF